MSASRPVEVEDLSVRFGARSALSRVSWTASAGELVALAGPNGSGKSTLLRACLGLLAPTQGTVRLFGTDCGQLSIRERARRVAWVPQEEAPRDNLRLIEYVLFGRYAHLPPFTGESADDRRTAERALAEAGLADRADSGILELSGGERQRLLLARALAQETPLLLLDEPTAHLDIGHQLDLFERVRRQVRDRGLCAIAAMHDLNLAARFADRILVLSHGRLVSDGPPESVLSVPLLREVWGVETELRRDPHSHRPYLLPLRAAAEGRLSSPADRR
ncbi:MAG: ABC transporter ATP-binding protein, partial [Thermoplasmata archaeon]|nr:ABC transporter ATP-binding protein [Thermoplasmata archaeon]